MTIEIKAPDVGEGVTQVTVTEWRKAVGEAVDAGEVIVELMTDKAAFDVESPVTGTVVAIIVENDEEVSVGAVLGLVDV